MARVATLSADESARILRHPIHADDLPCNGLGHGTLDAAFTAAGDLIETLPDEAP